MIVVTTPTGQIGSGVVQRLLSAGEKIRVIARDPARLEPVIRERVEVIQGSIDDTALLEKALAGAESLFWLVPPSFRMGDSVEYYLQFTRPACAALRKNRVARVVTVSGIGRTSTLKAGPVTGSFVKDDALEKSVENVRALWCPGFMENMLMQVESLRRDGVFAWQMPANTKEPLAATRDIAEVAARLLTDRTWTGHGGTAVLGPEALSCDDLARILTDVLEKPVRFQELTPQEYRAQLLARGASQGLADGLVEMHLAKSQGLDHTEPRTAENTTPTTFRQWSQEVLRPAVLGLQTNFQH